MTPRGKRRMDLAASATKWLGIAGAGLALFKGYSDLRTQNRLLAGSVATVVQDQASESERHAHWHKELAQLGRRVEKLERKIGAPAGRRAAAPEVSGIEVVARSPGPLEIITAPFRWLGHLLGGG